MSKNESNLSLSELKQSLIDDLDNRVADRILEPANRDLLKKLINNAENKTEAISIAELGTTYKRTGFHFDKKLEKLTDTIKYFKKNTELSFVTDSNKLTHKLIIGDNYDALLNLSISYKNKIDVIYIDPPYGKDDMGEFAHTNYDNAISRDNLLSMLYPRLVLARELLTDEGVIFCSIDDKNQAYVKGLFDEIFNEHNCECLIWNTEAEGKSGTLKQVSRFRNIHEYIIVAYKEKQNVTFNKLSEPLVNKPLQTTNLAKNNDDKNGDPNRIFTIINPLNNKEWVDEWKYDRNYIDELQKNGLLYYGVNGENKPREILPTDERRKVYIESIINKGSSTLGRKNFEEICAPDSFRNPKPVVLIKTLLKLFKADDCLILDFYAGSGTTGQAVLELNKEDGGNRTFILCTNNEKTDMNPNGIAYDVTSKRLKRVMTGECYDGSKDFKWNKDHQPLGDNLDVYEIDQVSNINQAPGECAFDVIDETLYGIDKLEPKEKIKFVCENFSVTQKTIEE